MWEWDIWDAFEKDAYIFPCPDLGGADVLYGNGETSAKPLFAQSQHVYGLDLSHDGTRVAYVTDSGAWLHNLQKNISSQLAGSLELLELAELSHLKADAVYHGFVPHYADVYWSPDDRYVALWTYTYDESRGQENKLRVIDVNSREMTMVSNKAALVAWRPVAKGIK